jgi:hypothetical protein
MFIFFLCLKSSRFVFDPCLQNVMRSSSDEEITLNAQQFVHLPQIVARNSPASNSPSASPAYHPSHGLQQPLHAISRTPPSHDLGRSGAGASGGAKLPPSFGQQQHSPSFGQQHQRPTSAIRLASLSHTPTFKQTSPKDDGDDSRCVSAAFMQYKTVTVFAAGRRVHPHNVAGWPHCPTTAVVEAAA